MRFVEAAYPDGPRSDEAAHLIFKDVFGEPLPPQDASARFGDLTQRDHNYWLEGDEVLIGVGTIDGRFIGDGVALIAHIAVAERFRHSGFGKVLLECIETRARELGCGLARVSALDDAVNVYMHLGYQPVDPTKPTELAKLL